ncbi:hypothetical protein niasHT_009344 [Heterodera trifolii]|uniref:Transposase n=1 Tax=Heterodera trifolii TaxID=157864 RepID=A0ABD2M217_9BILA
MLNSTSNAIAKFFMDNNHLHPDYYHRKKQTVYHRCIFEGCAAKIIMWHFLHTIEVHEMAEFFMESFQNPDYYHRKTQTFYDRCIFVGCPAKIKITHSGRIRRVYFNVPHMHQGQIHH